MGNRISRRYSVGVPSGDTETPLISSVSDYGTLGNLREPNAKFKDGMKAMLDSMAASPEMKEITFNRCVATRANVDQIDYHESITAMIATKTSLDDAKELAVHARTANIAPHLGNILAAVSVFAQTVCSSEDGYDAMMEYVRNTLSQCQTFADLEAQIKADREEHR